MNLNFTHLTSTKLIPQAGKAPELAQIYIFDPADQLLQRQEIFDNLDTDIIQELQALIL